MSLTLFIGAHRSGLRPFSVTVWGAIFRLFAKSAAVLERESPALLVTLCAVAGRRTGTLSKDALEGLWERSAAILQLCSSSTNAHPLDIVALLVRSEYQPHPSYTDGFGRARTTTRLLWLTSASRYLMM